MPSARSSLWLRNDQPAHLNHGDAMLTLAIWCLSHAIHSIQPESWESVPQLHKKREEAKWILQYCERKAVPSSSPSILTTPQKAGAIDPILQARKLMQQDEVTCSRHPAGVRGRIQTQASAQPQSLGFVQYPHGLLGVWRDWETQPHLCRNTLNFPTNTEI